MSVICGNVNRLLLSIVVAFSGLFTVMAAEVPQQVLENPHAVIRIAGTATFERLHKERELIKEDPNHLRLIVREELLPYVDVRYASYKVMGSELRKTSKEQRERFVDVFGDHLVFTYAQILTLYSGQKVEYGPEGKFKDKKIVTVKAVILEPAGADINIDFKMRRNSKTGVWKAYDMVAEGVSLLSSKQSELGGLIRREGIDEVSNKLEALNMKPIKEKAI